MHSRSLDFQKNLSGSFSSNHHHPAPLPPPPHAVHNEHEQRIPPRAADMMATMPLLTPSEAHAFQSFLEHVDYSDVVAPEWAMYTNGVHEEYADDDEPRLRPLNDPLTRATKDLMSLDTNPITYSESAAADRHISIDLNLDLNLTLKPISPSRTDLHLHSLPDFTAVASPHLQRPPLTVAPSRTTLESSASSDSQYSSSDLTPPPLTPPSLKRPYPSVVDPSKVAGPSSGVRARSSSASVSGPVAGPSSSKGASASRTNAPAAPSAPKKSRVTAPHQTGPILGAKPSLLTPSQKKANHIQSEQKRRANIRRGYEALCETVPSLREAIRAEEEAQALANAAGSRSRSKKKSRGKKVEQAEKIDGRAGPKSENIVLQKSWSSSLQLNIHALTFLVSLLLDTLAIDHIQDLLSDHAALKDRLNRARSVLPPGHMALFPQTGGEQPLWEREWHGGVGLLDDGNADEADSDEDES